MINLRKAYGATIILILYSLVSFSSHINGGVITVCKLGARTFEFTLIGYRTTGSIVPFGGGTFDFDDGTSADFSELEIISSETAVPGVEKVEAKVVHEYTAVGAYTVSYSEDSRTEVINIDNSFTTSFYVETTFETWMANCTPRIPLENLFPVFRTGKLEMRDLLAVDEEGDKIRYSLTTPRQSRNQKVNNYRYPNFAGFYSHYENGNFSGDGKPGFSVNRNTGTLVWNAPGNSFHEAVYTIALSITEYREINGQETKISTTIADVNLAVANGFNVVVLKENDNFCTNGDNFLSFEVRSENPYRLSVQPGTLIHSVNELPFTTLQDSTFTTDAEFNVLLNDAQGEQFVTFTITSVDDEMNTFSSFTNLLSEDCEQYILSTETISKEPQLPLLYPNPAQDELWTRNAKANLRYVIVGMDGREIRQGILNADGKISLFDIKSGVYAIQLYFQDSQSTSWQHLTSERLIIQK